MLDLSDPVTPTGIGSVPGDDVRTAATWISDQLTTLPHMPELPERGPGADMIGRTLAILADVAPEFGADTTPTGWRLGPAGVAARRARSWLLQDMETIEEVWRGHRGLAKAQLAGPWTLAAAVEYRGRSLLADPAAIRDLLQAWQAGVAHHRDQLRRHLPATWLIQMDEPGLAAVIRGSVPTPSGFATYPAADVQGLAGLGADLVHVCASSVPYRRLTGFAAVLVDFDRHDPADDEAVCELMASGSVIGFGVSDPRTSVGVVMGFLDRTGMTPERLLVHPPCGMVGDYRPWLHAAADLNDRLG